MKTKTLVFTALIATLILFMFSCNANVPADMNDNVSRSEAQHADTSVSEDVSLPEESAAQEESVPEESTPEEESVPEESEPVVDYSKYDGYVIGTLPEGEWYSQEELPGMIDQALYISRSVAPNGQRHVNGYYGLEYHFVDSYFSTAEREKYLAMFDRTEYMAVGHVLEYFNIPWEDYIGFYTDYEYRRIMSLGEYEHYGTPVYAKFYPIFAEDVWYNNEFWNDERFIPYGYRYADLDDHYTHIEDRNGYTRYYYIIDRLLINYVGQDAFNQWLANTDDKEQNILKFIDDFDITLEIYNEIFKNQENKAHNTDYLFGTPEMQKEYFTVHPINKE